MANLFLNEPLVRAREPINAVRSDVLHRLLPLWCAGLVACSGESTLSIGLPEVEDAASVIAALSIGDELVLGASDMDDGVRIDLPVEGDAGQVELLTYDRTLQQLGFAPGRLEIRGDGVSLPPERQTFIAPLVDGAVGPWETKTARSMALDEVRLDVDERCVTVVPEAAYELPDTEDCLFAMLLEEERALVSMEPNGDLYYVTPDGFERVTDHPPTLPTRVATRTDSGLLFGSVDGRISRVEVTSSTTTSPIAIRHTPLTVLPGGTPIRWMVAGEEGGALEIFALDGGGRFLRYADGAWAVLFDFALETSRESGLVRVRPGLAYVGGDLSRQIIRYKDGVVESYGPPDLEHGVPGMIYEPGFGVAVATQNRMLRLADPEDGTWELIEGNPIALNVYSFIPYQDGLLMGSAFGSVAQYKRTIGYCPATLIAAGSIRDILPFGDGRLLFGVDSPASRGFGQVQVVRLR